MSNEVMFGNQSSAEYADTDLFQSQRGSTSRMERKDHALNPSFVLTPDKTNLFVQDWGSGLPVLFLAAWTLDSSVWGSHIASLVRHGFRCLAVDRRGHGRSDAPCFGYDLDTLAEDLSCVLEQKDLRDVVLVAHSMASIEAVRYCGTYGMDRIGHLVLTSPTTPYLIQTPDNPDAVPICAVEAQLAAIAEDFPKWVAENEAPFFTPNTIPETRNWIKDMMLSVSLPVALACRRTIAEADTRGDLRKITIRTLILQGDADASAPLDFTGMKTAKLIQNSDLIVYPGAPHALPITHRERFIADVLRFIRS